MNRLASSIYLAYRGIKDRIAVQSYEAYFLPHTINPNRTKCSHNTLIFMSGIPVNDKLQPIFHISDYINDLFEGLDIRDHLFLQTWREHR